VVTFRLWYDNGGVPTVSILTAYGPQILSYVTLDTYRS